MTPTATLAALSETYTALIGMCARAAAEEAAFIAGAGATSSGMPKRALYRP